MMWEQPSAGHCAPLICIVLILTPFGNPLLVNHKQSWAKSCIYNASHHVWSTCLCGRTANTIGVGRGATIGRIVSSWCGDGSQFREWCMVDHLYRVKV